MKTKIFYVSILLISFFIAACGNKVNGNKVVSKINPGVQNKVTPQQQNTNYLTVQDVEKVSGIKDVIFVSKSSIPGAGGDLNFATKDSNLIIMVQITDKSNFDSYKSYYFKSEIKSLGDEAMEGVTTKGMPDNIVVFKKGGKCVAISVFISPDDFKKNIISQEQSIQLAKIIESKI